MPIDSICSGCGKTLRVGDEFAGRQARCPLCNTVYTVTNSVSTPAPIESSSEPLAVLEPIYDPVTTPESPSASNTVSSPFPSNSVESPFSTSSRSQQTVAPMQYMVKTPSGSEYGPVELNTVLQWYSQGRVNDTCFIRDAGSSQWVGFATWRFQQRSQIGQASENAFSSNEFAPAPTTGAGSIQFARTGNGLAVLVLGILSWVMCITFLGAPVCAVIALGIGYGDLSAMRNGRMDMSDRTLTLIGMWLAGVNLAMSTLPLMLVIVISVIGS